MSPELARKASDVVAAAKARGVSIATAESCTAGALATLLADTPGAGDVFLGGFVTYAKEAKTALLGVPVTLIAEHTAVSPIVAEAMAQGALEASGADIAIAVTGVAGPEADEDGNPVGLVYLAATGPPRPVLHAEFRSPETSRGANRMRALSEALTLLARVLSRVS
jgi:nicotinamide-nucleotide amidase